MMLDIRIVIHFGEGEDGIVIGLGVSKMGVTDATNTSISWPEVLVTLVYSLYGNSSSCTIMIYELFCMYTSMKK